LHEAEIQNKNLLLFTGVVLLCMVVAVTALIYSRYKNRARTARVLEEKNTQIESQNKLLLKKTADEEVLLHEIHHRVKNNLQIISSLINLKVRQSSVETAEVLDQLNGRIFSMGLIHEKLFEREQLQTVRMDEYLGELARHLTTSLGDPCDSFQLTTDCEPVEADLEVAISCGLISNELITNSMKHAFSPEQKERLINLSFKSGDGNIHFNITDNGCGSVEMRNGSTRSFGLRFVDQLVTSKLKGAWQITNAKGFQASIVFPSK
jgi:two-component sensor histidine kinase